MNFEIQNFRLLRQGDPRFLASFDVVLDCGITLISMFIYRGRHATNVDAVVRAPEAKLSGGRRAFRLPDDLRQAIGTRVGATYRSLSGKPLTISLPTPKPIPRGTGVLYTTDAGIAHYEPDDAASAPHGAAGKLRRTSSSAGSGSLKAGCTGVRARTSSPSRPPFVQALSRSERLNIS